METIGQKIYKLRKKTGLSQEDLAFRAGVTRQTISKWEMDSMQPNAENLRTLGTIFGVSADSFFADASTSATKSDEPVDEAALQKRHVKKRMALHIVFATLCVLLCAFCCAATVILHGLSCNTNPGDDSLNTGYVASYIFYLPLVLTIVTFCASALFVYFAIHTMRQYRNIA